MKNFSNFHNCPKSFPKVRKSVLNKCWVNFFEQFFCPVFHGGSSLRNVFKKSKIFQNSIIAQNRSQKCANVFWTSVGLTFSNNFFAQCSMEGRVFEMLFKKLKKFKLPKTLKIVPKLSKSVLNMFWGKFFEKIFLPSVPWRVEYSKCFQKIENISKFQKRPKIVPKLSKSVLNMFWGNFFENFICPVFHGGSSLRNVLKKSKNFQISKNAQNRTQKCANAFWTCFEVIFSKIFFAQCSMEGRVFEMFLKNQKIFKIPKTPKIVPKLSKSVLNVFWGTFSGNFSLRSVAWRVESSKCF